MICVMISGVCIPSFTSTFMISTALKQDACLTSLMESRRLRLRVVESGCKRYDVHCCCFVTQLLLVSSAVF